MKLLPTAEHSSLKCFGTSKIVECRRLFQRRVMGQVEMVVFSALPSLDPALIPNDSVDLCTEIPTSFQSPRSLEKGGP